MAALDPASEPSPKAEISYFGSLFDFILFPRRCPGIPLQEVKCVCVWGGPHIHFLEHISYRTHHPFWQREFDPGGAPVEAVSQNPVADLGAEYS